jgi:hypothetical protein
LDDWLAIQLNQRLWSRVASGSEALSESGHGNYDLHSENLQEVVFALGQNRSICNGSNAYQFTCGLRFSHDHRAIIAT